MILLDFLKNLFKNSVEDNEVLLTELQKQENRHYVGLVLMAKRKYRCDTRTAIKIVNKSLLRRSA